MQTTAQTLGQLLRGFCAPDPSQTPGLAFPCYISGPNGKPYTFASDGQSIALWTPGKLGRYKDWSAAGSPDGFSPSALMKKYRAGASTPLPLPRADGSATAFWLGSPACIGPAHYAKLVLFDTCYLGGAPATGKNQVWAHTSFVATLDKLIFRGICALPFRNFDV